MARNTMPDDIAVAAASAISSAAALAPSAEAERWLHVAAEFARLAIHSINPNAAEAFANERLKAARQTRHAPQAPPPPTLGHVHEVETEE